MRSHILSLTVGVAEFVHLFGAVFRPPKLVSLENTFAKKRFRLSKKNVNYFRLQKAWGLMGMTRSHYRIHCTGILQHALHQMMQMCFQIPGPGSRRQSFTERPYIHHWIPKTNPNDNHLCHGLRCASGATDRASINESFTE